MLERTIEVNGETRALVDTIDVARAHRRASGCRRRWCRSAAPPPGFPSACRSWRRTCTTGARCGRPNWSSEVLGGYRSARLGVRLIVRPPTPGNMLSLTVSEPLPLSRGSTAHEDPMNADDHYVVISADCHGGGEIHEYRDYLASKYHDEFDAWVADYQIPFADLLGDIGKRNWDSDRRLRDLEADGIAAEVIFPNTIPPFFPGGALVTQAPPADAHELELRWAGLQAHNRWLADFCAAVPGRRAGIAQIMLHDVDASVEEIHCREGTRPHRRRPAARRASRHRTAPAAPQALRAALGRVRRGRHPGEPPRGERRTAARMEQEDIVMFLLEVTWWSHNVLTNLIVGGVLERHPGSAVRLHRAGHRVGPRAPRACSTTSSTACATRSARRSASGACRSSRSCRCSRASTGRASATSAPASSGRRRCRSASRSGSTGSCGGATTRTRRRATRSRRRRSGSASPASTPPRCR